MSNLKPKLRFPEFLDRWFEIKFGQVYSFRTTNSFSRENLNYDFGTIKNIHYGDIHTKFKTQFRITRESVPYINSEINIEKILEENYCKEGDLIIADASEDYADIGKSIEIIDLNSEKTLAGLHTFIARPDLFKMSLGFSGYLMQSEKIRLQIKTIAQGSKVLGISTGRLSTIDLFISTPSEQTKIANFLTAVDEKIQALKEKKRLLEEYKKGLMQKIFSQKIRFKQEDGSDFPNWEEKTLGEITFKTDKKNKDKEVLPVYSISNKNGFVHQSEQFDGVDSVERGYDISLYKIVESTTFAYNPARINVGSIGYSGNLERVLVSSLYVCFKTIDIVDNQFFSQFLKTKHFNDSVNSSSEGGIRLYLFYENFSQIKITLPSLDEQQKIASFLTSFDDKIEKVGQQIEDAQTFKKGLLQQMFV